MADTDLLTVKKTDTQKRAEEQLVKIINEKRVHSVYQPIVSLEDGSILGYEGLSRIDLKQCLFNVEEMFHLAEKMGKTWELEKLCRRRTLKNAGTRPTHAKLFINVDPKIISHPDFLNEMAYTYWKDLGIRPRDIIMEITERTSIEDTLNLKKALQELKDMDFQVAIDDFGNGYAGLRRVCSLEADCLKIDMTIVRDIDKDSIKRTLVESFVSFCENAGIKLIAEGIETEGELKTLVQLKVAFGQGYYLGKPNHKMLDIAHEKKELIKQMKKGTIKYSYKPSFFGNIGSICKQKDTTTPETPGYALFEYVESNPQVSEICVVGKRQEIHGLLTKTELLEKFGGRFGYSLHAKKTAKDLLVNGYLAVDAMESIEEVSKMALARTPDHMYDAVIVTQNDQYLGIVTVKDLLETAITIQVSRAVDANPLTKLPGNNVIEEHVKKSLGERSPFGIIYIDLDNFKAYNDAYGFSNGDLMLLTAANVMINCCEKGEFCGHIGGDDFVIICKYWDVEPLCQKIIDQFKAGITDLYNTHDLENGYILAKNRNGFEETFPLTTLSIAVVTNRNNKYSEIGNFSKDLAEIKKKCKQIKGNSVICI